MPLDNRTYRRRTIELAGTMVEFQVYVAENGKERIEEGEALRLASKAGITAIKVESIQAVPDNLYFWGPIGEIHSRKFPKGVRFVALASCVDANGKVWQMAGNAAPDNLEESFWSYAAEIACKRAVVRTVIRALGLDLNADVEFSSGFSLDDSHVKTEAVKAETVKQEISEAAQQEQETDKVVEYLSRTEIKAIVKALGTKQVDAPKLMSLFAEQGITLSPEDFKNLKESIPKALQKVAKEGYQKMLSQINALPDKKAV